jgi:hypothetical protein
MGLTWLEERAIQRGREKEQAAALLSKVGGLYPIEARSG